jgi:hypothetical protein
MSFGDTINRQFTNAVLDELDVLSSPNAWTCRALFWWGKADGQATSHKFEAQQTPPSAGPLLLQSCPGNRQLIRDVNKCRSQCGSQPRRNGPITPNHQHRENQSQLFPTKTIFRHTLKASDKCSDSLAKQDHSCRCYLTVVITAIGYTRH